MSTLPPDLEREFVSIGADAPDLSGYDSVEVDDGTLVVHATDGEDAWIRSDVHLDLSLLA